MTEAEPGHNGLTYRASGVNIDAGNELVRRIAPAAARTRRPEILGGVGGFAALSRLPARYREPILVTGTDGVGTKLRLAIDHDRHDDVGQDLVAMCVNDCLVVGAEPLLFLDYYATARLDVDVAARVIEGIARACELAGCALAGGETAEMPGFYGDGEYDLAGFCVGVAEREDIVDGTRIAPGDALLALGSSGPHSNGFSLIRHILEHDGADVSADPALLDQLMQPTRIYVAAIRGLQDAGIPLHGMAHITGGGLPENLPRMLTDTGCELRVDLDSWSLPPLFQRLARAGGLQDMELLRTLNCGVGFVICLPDAQADAAIAQLEAGGEQAWRLGHIVASGTPIEDGAWLCTSAEHPARIEGNWR